MNDKPLISIVVPVYNAEKYLDKCLSSLTSQSYKNIEIICVNDGSKDSSLNILKEYQEKNDRVVVIDKANEGVSVARNVALDIAKGEYILFVDSDDWIDISTCEEAVNTLLEENADLVMWPYVKEYKDFSENKVIFKESKIVFDREKTKRLHRRLFGLIDAELKNPESADALCTIWGKLYKSAFIKENGIRFEDIKNIGTYEDGLFNVEVFKHLNKVVYVNRHLYHYRKDNETSITTVYKSALAEQRRKLFNLMSDYITTHDLGNEYVKALQNRIALSILDIGLNSLSSNKSCKQKKKEIAIYLLSPEYKEAVKNLELKYFKLHWKVFFWCAKHGYVFGVYLLLKIIKKIIGK